MARVLIDVCVTSQVWFKSALVELAKCSNVKFVYSDHSKYAEEIRRVPDLAKFIKVMADQGRADKTQKDLCVRLIKSLESDARWKKNKSCDDPHIFSMAYQKPSIYLFTTDLRICTCKSAMSNQIDKKFMSFRAITNDAIYQTHKPKILN